MRMRHQIALLTLVSVLGLLVLTVPLTQAQESSPSQNVCAALIDRVLDQVGSNCANLDGSSACYGYGSVAAQFTSGAAYKFNLPTDRISLDLLSALHTSAFNPATEELGIAMLNVAANPAVLDGLNLGDVKYFLFGDVELVNAVSADDMFLMSDAAPVAYLVSDTVLRAAPSAAAPDLAALTSGSEVRLDGITADGAWLHVVTDSYTAWMASAAVGDIDLTALPKVKPGSLYPMQAFNFTTSGAALEGCAGVPAAMLVLQAPPNALVDVIANGVPLRFSNTIFLRTDAEGSLEVINISGDVVVSAGDVQQSSFRAAGALAARVTTEGIDYRYRAMSRAELDSYEALEALPENLLYTPVALPLIAQPSGGGEPPPIIIPPGGTPFTGGDGSPPDIPFPVPPLDVGTFGQDLDAPPWDGFSVGDNVCVPFIIYHGDRSGAWEIYLSLLNGEDDINLSQYDQAPNIQPSRSPDGAWVAFSSSRDDGNWEIYISRTDGSEVRRVSYNTGVDLNPVWGENNIILFESNRDANWELYAFDVSTGEFTRLTDFPDGADIDPSWSPDNQFVVFSRYIDGDYELMLLNIETLEVTQLTDNDVDDISAQFSSDITKLAWLQRSASTGVFNLMLRDLELPENQDTDLSNNTDEVLVDLGSNISLNLWAPDDSFIVFDSNVDGDYDVFVVEIELEDGDTVRDIKNVTGNTFQDRAATFVCGRDRLAYQSDLLDEARNFDLFEINPLNANGGIEPTDVPNAPTRITEFPENEIYSVNTRTDEDASREGRVP